MSIEPTCDFCGASDKSRCKSATEAIGCNQFHKNKLIREETDGDMTFAEKARLPNLTMTDSLEDSDVAVSAIRANPRLTIQIDTANEGSVSLFLTPEEVDRFCNMLQSMKKYITKGYL